MKRWTSSVVMAAAVALGAYSLAGAQAPAQGEGWGAGGRAGGGPAGALLMLRGLDLSEQQRQQLREIRESQPASREAFTAERQLHRQLALELAADAPDTLKLAELQRQIGEAQAARLARQVELGQQIAQVLTAEQRSTLRERLAQAPERRAPGARRGAGPGSGAGKSNQ